MGETIFRGKGLKFSSILLILLLEPLEPLVADTPCVQVTTERALVHPAAVIWALFPVVPREADTTVDS